MNLVVLYLLVGLGVSFLIEHIIRWNEENVTFGERLWMVVLWPILVIVSIYSYIKGFMEGFNDNWK